MLMRFTRCGTAVLIAALMLAGCGQPAQQTAAPAAPDTTKSANASGTADTKTDTELKRLAIPDQFEEAGIFSDGLASVRIGAKFGYIDTKGNVAIKPQFDFAGPFAEGVAHAGIGPKVGYVDKTGNFVITPNLQIVDLFAFSEGLAAVRVGEYLSGKWGFIDKQGKLVIPAQYEGAGSFSDGL